MKKIFLIIALVLFPLNIFAINLNSSKYIIYDNTDGKVLLEKGSNTNTSIASLTKIMSAIIIIEKEEDLNKKITITKKMLNSVPNNAFTINLKKGEVYTYQDLLYATILPSAADAIISLAINSSGSISNFVKEMNNKAQDLGMKNTYFTNPIGMDNVNNKNTISDVLTLLKYALKNDIFRTIYQTKEYTMSNGKKIYTSLKMYNEDLKLNLDTSRIIGSKTGYTKKTGFALSQVFNSNFHEIISITTGAVHNNNSYHLRDGIEIIKYIDNNYNNQTLMKKNELIKTLEVRDSTINEYKIYSDKELIKYLPNNYNKEDFKIEYNIPEYIDYKTNKDIGNIKYFYGNELLYTENVIIKEDINPNFISILKDNIIYIICIITFLLIIIYLIFKKRSLKYK